MISLNARYPRKFGPHRALCVTLLIVGTATFSAFVAGCDRSDNTHYRVLTSEDGLSCAFSQDISASMDYGPSGQMSATKNHFDCTNVEGKSVSIELDSADLVNGKVGIKTKRFGTIFRGNEPGSFDKYEMTERQILKLKKFLGY